MGDSHYDIKRQYHWPNLWLYHNKTPLWGADYYPKQFLWHFKGTKCIISITVYLDIRSQVFIWDYDSDLIEPMTDEEYYAINQAFYWINHQEKSPIKGLSAEDLLTKLF